MKQFVFINLSSVTYLLLTYIVSCLQKFEKDDYRLVRFVDKKKHVNKQFAIDLIAKVPPAAKKERVVWCDGGGGPTGHPKVYINLVRFNALVLC